MPECLKRIEDGTLILPRMLSLVKEVVKYGKEHGFISVLDQPETEIS